LIWLEVVYGAAGRYELVEDWFALLDMCDRKAAGSAFDQKQFRTAVDAWGKEWARSGIEAQGHISEIITSRLIRIPDMQE
jgi:hypothetical protein